LNTVIAAEQALLPDGWHRNLRVTIGDGAIAGIEWNAPPQDGDERCAALLPTVANLHSHAFQRAMAGLAEVRGPSDDTFWTWREVMYRHALTMTPEQVEAVAAMLYVEMLEAGFGRVGEFHYLHHDRDGRPYADIAELTARITAAAAATGIRLTLLPVFYAHANFGAAAPTAGQRRFINDVNRFACLLESSRKAVESLPEANVGIAPHSLRAVAPGELAELLAIAPDGPVHIHVAEQVREVDDCLAWSGARPVQWLLDNAPVDGRWCLIHATHMTDREAAALGRTGATAGLCPITEANLGDGIFNARPFADAGGGWGIGSDSNIQIGVAAELRQFEYAQRLGNRQRNVMAGGPGSTGRALFDAARAGGAAALGAASPGIAVGAPADLWSLDTSHATFEGKCEDAVLDAFIFTGQGRPDAVWIGGRKLVDKGRHIHRESIDETFRKAMRELAET
jgi:formimidoylglutamate deiminase